MSPSLVSTTASLTHNTPAPISQRVSCTRLCPAPPPGASKHSALRHATPRQYLLHLTRSLCALLECSHTSYPQPVEIIDKLSTTNTMKGPGISKMWADIVQYRRAYFLTAVASFGGMLFGWDTGLIGGVLTMKSFNNSFGLDPESPGHASLEGNIVSVLQAGCFFGAASSFYLSDKLGRKRALMLADLIFIIGSIVQTTCAMGQGHDLAQLYVGRVIGGFGVGLVSAVVPTYIGENANKEIRGVSRRHCHHVSNTGNHANTSQSDASAACNCSSKFMMSRLQSTCILTNLKASPVSVYPSSSTTAPSKT